MNIKEFRAELDRLMPQAGFIRGRIPKNPHPVWRIDSHDVDLVRFFYPDSMRRPWGCVLLGSLVIEIPAFATWVEETGALPNKRPAVFGAYISNFRTFQDAVAVNGLAELPALRRWIEAIHNKLAQLPTSLSSFCDAYQREDELLDHFRGSDPELWYLFGNFLEANPSILNTIH